MNVCRSKDAVSQSCRCSESETRCELQKACNPREQFVPSRLISFISNKLTPRNLKRSKSVILTTTFFVICSQSPKHACMVDGQLNP